MDTVAIYSRVSTSDQDASRQLHELRDFAEREYPDAEIVEFVDIISGTATDEAEQYQTLRSEIAADGVDAVVVDEISRLSRLGGGEIHDFIQQPSSMTRLCVTVKSVCQSTSTAAKSIKP